MKKFLEYVAEDIIRKHGTNLSRTAVVFPNKRASLFMNKYLMDVSKQPMWSPAYITISDLFRGHSELQVPDQLKLICDLHKCFTEITKMDESLDHFYGWGQLMISDFDDIDKNNNNGTKDNEEIAAYFFHSKGFAELLVQDKEVSIKVYTK